MPFTSSIFASGIQNLWGYFLKKRCRLPRKCGCIFPLVYQKGNIMGHLTKWKNMMLNSENLLLSRRVLLSNYLSFSSYFLMLLKSPRIASEPADSRNIVNFKKYARPSQVSTSRVRIHFFLSLYFDPFLQCLLHRLSPKRMICMRESKALFLSSSKGEWRLQNLFLGICFWDAKKGQCYSWCYGAMFYPRKLSLFSLGMLKRDPMYLRIETMSHAI